MNDDEDEKKLHKFMVRYQRWQAENDKIQKILMNLKQANLIKECQYDQSNFAKASQTTMIGLFFYSMYRFKTISQKITAYLGLCAIKMFWLDTYTINNYFKNVAMDENTVIAQEIRNLYTFYFPNQNITPKLLLKIDEYNIINKERMQIND